MSSTVPMQHDVDKRPNTLESFRLLADTIPTLCWMADAKGTIYWYNKRWHEYTGLNPEQTTAEDWQSAHDPRDHAHIIEKWKQAVKTKEPFDMIVSLRGADGIFRPFLSHIVPSMDDEGKLNGWLGIKNDISELRAADKALKESQHRFKTLVEAMPQMAFMADADGNITYYNQRWYEYVGGLGDTEGWGWKDRPIHHPDDLKRTVDTWKKSLKTGEDYEIEYRLRRHDGQYRWHLGRAVAIHDDAGKIVSWIGTNTDIHEQKRLAQNQDFLLGAADELSKTLDYKATLKTIADLCVPVVADWCSVDIVNDKGLFDQVAVAHVDKKKIQLAKEFRARNPIDARDRTSGVPKVVSTGKTEFYPYIDEALLKASIKDPETLQFMQKLDLHSIIIAPIAINGKRMGAVTFVASGTSGAYYTKDDVAMVEELASRISLAISNATLYDQVQTELGHRKKLEKELLHHGNIIFRVVSPRCTGRNKRHRPNSH